MGPEDPGEFDSLPLPKNKDMETIADKRRAARLAAKKAWKSVV